MHVSALMYFSSVSSVLHLCQLKTPQVMFLNLIFVFINIHYIYCGWRRLVCCFASVLVDTGSSKRSLYFHSIAPHQLVCAGISYCLSCLLRYKCVWGCLACFMSLYDVGLHFVVTVRILLEIMESSLIWWASKMDSHKYIDSDSPFWGRMYYS